MLDYLVFGILTFWLSSSTTGSLTIEPKDKLYWVKASRTLTLTCISEKDVSWYKDNKAVVSNDELIIYKQRTIIGNTEKHLTKIEIEKSHTEDSGNYSCTDGTYNRSVDVIVIQGQLKIFPSDTVTVFEGDPLTLSCNYEGDMKPDVMWYRDVSEPLTKYGFVSSRRSFTNQNVKTTLQSTKDQLSVKDAGIYYCVAGPYVKKLDVEVLKDSCDTRLVKYVQDDQLTASSFYKDILHDDSPYCARLNISAKFSCRAWSPLITNNKQWIQISFANINVIRNIMTQGRGSNDSRQEWVTSYRLTYSQDGVSWNKYKDFTGKIVDFAANFDKTSTVTTALPIPVVAKFLRIHPITWENKIALRLEVSGCLLPSKIEITNENIGKVNLRIPDSLQLQCEYSGPLQPDFVWYKDNTRITENSGYNQTISITWKSNMVQSIAILRKNNTQYSDSGLYTCVDIMSRQNKSVSVYAAQLEIKPSFRRIWVLTNTRLQISCEYSGTISRDITWRRDGNKDFIRNSGFHITTNKRMEHSVSQTTSNITKDKVTVNDRCNITCSDGESVRNIEVIVLSVNGNTHQLFSDRDLTLTCDAGQVNNKYSFEVYWTKNYTPLNMVETMKGRYHYSADARVLTIASADIDDAGHYECNILLDVGTSQQQQLTLPLEVIAKPNILLEGQQEIKVGDTLHLYCKVSGYPVPKVTWYKDEFVVDNSRCNFLPYAATPNGHMVLFDVQSSDKGTYKCEGSTEQFQTVSSNLFLKVKEKPFIENLLLICVVVSCAVIVIVIVCCAVCYRCRSNTKHPMKQNIPMTDKPLLTRRYVDMQIITRTKSLTSLEEIDQLPPPPPPVDPWDDNSTNEDTSLTYERIPKLRDRKVT